MRIRECTGIFLKDILLPLILILVMFLIAYPVCNKADGMDIFLLWIIVGFPFGIRRMLMWLFPHNYDLSGTVGVIGLDCIIGGIIGGFVVVLMLGKSIVAFFKIIAILIAG